MSQFKSLGTVVLALCLVGSLANGQSVQRKPDFGESRLPSFGEDGGRTPDVGPLFLGANEVATSDGSILRDIAVRSRQGKADGYLVAFQVTPFGESEQSWELDVTRTGLDRQSTTLRIDGSLVYRISIGGGRDATATRVSVRTPQHFTSFSEDEAAVVLDPVAVAEIGNLDSYRQIIYTALDEMRRSIVIENPDVTASNCGSVCAGEHPTPADCNGWWDAYQCCLAEADKDTCRRACECGDSNWCMAWEFIISTVDHEACAMGLAL